MGVDLYNLMDELARFMEARAAVRYVRTPRELWIHRAIEGAECGDPYAVLTASAGAAAVVPVSSCSVQCMVRGKRAVEAWGMAQRLFDSLCDDHGAPLRMAALGDYRINGLDLRGLGTIGPDERGREQVVFNADLRVVPLQGARNG
jgi:hypothetical protein